MVEAGTDGLGYKYNWCGLRRSNIPAGISSPTLNQLFVLDVGNIVLNRLQVTMPQLFPNGA